MTTAMRIAFIGIGRMGLPMASFMAKAGYMVTAYDPDADRGPLFTPAGGKVAASGAAAVRDADVVFTSLANDAVLVNVLTGEQGLIAAMKTSAILVETSTVSPEASAAVATSAVARGIDYIRMPVSGNSNSAKLGQLTALASGPRAAWDRVLPIVKTFSMAQNYSGDAEQARYMKLAVNLIVVNTATILAEALALGRKGGIEWATLLDGLASSTIGSPWLKAKADRLKVHDYTPTFTTTQLQKDIDLMLAAGAKTGVVMPMTALTRQLTNGVVAAGLGEEDFIALVKLTERLSGLEPLDPNDIKRA